MANAARADDSRAWWFGEKVLSSRELFWEAIGNKLRAHAEAFADVSCRVEAASEEQVRYKYIYIYMRVYTSRGAPLERACSGDIMVLYTCRTILLIDLTGDVFRRCDCTIDTVLTSLLGL